MECYWKTILLLLAVLIQSSSGSTTTTEQPSAEPQTTKSTILETSTEFISTTEISASPKITTNSFSATTTPEQVTVSITSSVPSTTQTSSNSTSSITSNTSSTSTTVGTSTSRTDKTSPAAATTISTSSAPLTTTNTPTPPLTTTSTPTPPLTTTSTPTPPLTTTSTPTPPLTTTSTPTPPLTTTSTPTPPLTTTNTPSTTGAASGETTPAPPPLLGVLISETNLLLTNDSSTYFVEIQVTKNVHIDGIWLVIQNASVDGPEGLLLNHYINISSFNNDLYVCKNDTLSDKLMGVDSVLIALYAEDMSAGIVTTKGLHDILLYSSSGNISDGLKELFANIYTQNLIIDYKKLNISEPLSLSRCSENDIATSAAVLNVASPGQNNVCNVTDSSLEMKLTTMSHSCISNSPADFKTALKNAVISNVNKEKRCGLTAYMMTVTNVVCITDGKELDVKLTVSSVFPFQGTLIMDGYINFLRQKNLTIKGVEYYLTDCYQDCFHGTTPPTSTDDNRIRVTVAVVVSCIGVFLLVLLFVVLYLRRKRKGILQFHMTRLDEDDDLVGDMDDFVGNQGATFRNYR